MARALSAAIALLAVIAAPAAFADDAFVVVKAGKVITVGGKEFSPGMVVIRNGRIEAVGEKIEVPSTARVFEAPDGVVMPGLVHPRSRFGLAGYRRLGNNAELSAADELYPRPGDYRDALANGFVVLGLIPDGSGIPGNAVAIRPVDGSREEILLDGAGYLRLTFSNLPTDKRALRGVFKAAESAIAREEKARKAFEAAQKKAAAAAKKKAAEAKKKPAKPDGKGKGGDKGKGDDKGKGKGEDKGKGKKPPVFKPPPIPSKLQPFVDLVRKPEGGPRLLVEVLRAREVIHFDDGLGERELDPVFYLSNGETSDLFHVVETLGERRAAVVMTPRISYEPYTRTQRNLPAELAQAGARLAFAPIDDTPAGFAKHLSAVAQIVREGLDREVALRALTLVPAELLGLDHELGTLEKGRRGDLIVLDGDPFAAGTRVTRVLIDGETAWSKEGPQ